MSLSDRDYMRERVRRTVERERGPTLSPRTIGIIAAVVIAVAILVAYLN